MKSILVIVENRGLMNAVIMEIKKNIEVNSISVQHASNQATLTGENIKIKVASNDVSEIDKFGYDEVIELTTKKLVDDMLFNLTKESISKLLSENEGKKIIGSIDNIVVTGYPVSIHSREKVLNKEEVEKMLKNTAQTGKVIGEALLGVRSSCINCAKDKQDAGNFNLNSIPLQLLSKVNSETSSKEIDCILNTVKSIFPSGVIKYDKEGIELIRIERILEDKIKENLSSDEYKALEINVKLLQKIKEGYKPATFVGYKA